jgi:hypothetical protein
MPSSSSIEETWLSLDSAAVKRPSKRARRATPSTSRPSPGGDLLSKYEPQSKAELTALVDPARVTKLRDALLGALNGTHSHFIVVHGPVGCCKSSTLRFLVKELGCAIRVWDSDAMPAHSSNFDMGQKEQLGHDAHVSYTSALADFARFLSDATLPSLVGGRRSVSVLESLPPVAQDAGKQEQVHDMLFRTCNSTSQGTCVVLMLSSEAESGLSPTQLKELVGVQTLQQCEQVQFNALAPTRLEKRLKFIAEQEQQTYALDVVSKATGDIRACLNAMQFQAAGATSARDTNLDFTHAVAKLLRGKRDERSGKLGFVPEMVASSCDLDLPALTAFLHHNMHLYVGDVQNWSLILDVFAATDSMLGGFA